MLVRDTVGVGAAYPDEGALVFGMFRFREFFQCGEVVNLPDLAVGASVLSAEMIASGTAT